MSLKSKYGKVAVIMGGSSHEREVSLISGQCVLDSLQTSGIDAHKFDPAKHPLTDLIGGKFSRAVLMMHGKGGEDGTLQGALEYLKIPYTGSGVLASSLGMDKYRTKLIWQALNIPLPKSQYVTKKHYVEAQFKLELSLPVIVKPVCEGSTLGLSKVYQLSDLAPAIKKALACYDALLIEEMVIGDEFTVTVCDDKVYPVVKIEAPDGEYDYQNKYFTDVTRYLCPYDLGAQHSQIEAYALLGYNAVGARGVARLDFMQDKSGRIYFLEINTLPGMTTHSLVPMSFKAAGVDFAQLCLKILDGAALSD